MAGFRCLDGEILMGDVKNGYQATPNDAGNRLARQGQSELTGLLGPGSDAN